MQDINTLLTNFCLDNQEKFCDCSSPKELKEKLDQMIDKICYSNYGVTTELHIAQILAKAKAMEGLNTYQIAKGYFDYLELDS